MFSSLVYDGLPNIAGFAAALAEGLIDAWIPLDGSRQG